MLSQLRTSPHSHTSKISVHAPSAWSVPMPNQLMDNFRPIIDESDVFFVTRGLFHFRRRCVLNLSIDTKKDGI